MACFRARGEGARLWAFNVERLLDGYKEGNDDYCCDDDDDDGDDGGDVDNGDDNNENVSSDR